MESSDEHYREKSGLFRGVVFGIYVAIISVGLYTVAITSLPYSALGSITTMAPKPAVRAIMPQGWAFFTRNPQEPRLHIYRENQKDHWVNIDTEPMGSPRWLFGLDRTSRIQGIETATLLSRARPNKWKKCNESSAHECFQKIRDDRFEDISGIGTTKACGRIVIAQRKIVPWAWASASGETHMPVRYVPLDVAC